MSDIPGIVVPGTGSALAEPAGPRRADGVWRAAWRRFRRDRVGMVSLAIVGLYALLIALAAAGVIGRHWQDEVGVPDAPPTFLGPAAATPDAGLPVLPGATPASGALPDVDISDVDPLAPRYKEWNARAAQYHAQARPLAATLPLGGDRLGRDVLSKALKGTQISVSVGVLAAIVATLVGAALGAVAGFFGGWLGDLVEWVYNVVTAVPDILLFFAFAAVFGRGISTLVLILGLTGWTSQYRQVRAEFLKHARRDYVRAAEAIGAGPWARMFRHILPNASHVILVRMSLLVVGFIKAEVILSYLGLGVATDQVSWGTMLAEAQSELVLGHWWQLATATVMMAVFVTAFSLMADAWRDALDPKLRGGR
ncbi:MAG TPA: ABC transporter permease [Burkholderiaceae bacterium]